MRWSCWSYFIASCRPLFTLLDSVLQSPEWSTLGIFLTSFSYQFYKRVIVTSTYNFYPQLVTNPNHSSARKVCVISIACVSQFDRVSLRLDLGDLIKYVLRILRVSLSPLDLRPFVEYPTSLFHGLPVCSPTVLGAGRRIFLRQATSRLKVCTVACV